MATVSIILPCYNSLPDLQQCVESVISQDYKDWELIIVDNNSADRTEDFIKGLNEHRIKFFKIQNHGNIAKSRNFGLSVACGTFVAFIDSDDWWERQKLSYCVSHIGHFDVLCHSETWYFEKTKTKKIVKYGSPLSNMAESLIYFGNSLSTSAVFVRREALGDVGGFDESESIISSEDYDLWIRLALNNRLFKFVEPALGTYRVSKGSVSSNIIRNRWSTLQVVLKNYQNLPERKPLLLCFGLARVGLGGLKDILVRTVK